MTATATEEWAGRSAAEIAEGGVASNTSLYLWLRAGGKTTEEAVRQVARQYAVSNPVNLKWLAERCLRAEERERERAVAPTQVKIFEAEVLTYEVLRRGGGMGRREAVEEVARRFRHGGVNRPLLEQRLAEVERERFPRPDVDINAIAADATARLAELEQARLRLAPGALTDSDLMAELEDVESEIRSCRRTLELVSLARAAECEEKAA